MNSSLSDIFVEKEETQTWNKLSPTIDLHAKASDFVTFNNKDVDEFKIRWKKDDGPVNTHSSTISLHIAAYENSMKTSFSMASGSSIKKCKNTEQIFPASTFDVQVMS
uniref:Uncharacterized protein n=1 Tax=Panagrolaimus davidi TaxID=227884 RepID=A0A914Q955_9BILA